MTAFPPEDLKRLPDVLGSWMKTVLNDLESHNLTLNETVNIAQNRPVWRLLAATGDVHC